PPKTATVRGLKRLALGAGIAAIVAGAGWYVTDWWRMGRFIEVTDDAYAGGNVTQVSPHVAGFVTEILAADNEHVTAGQLLVRRDARDFRAALDHAQTVAEERQAALASLEAKHVLQQRVIAQAEANLAAKSAQADFASSDATRYRNLAMTGYGTRQNA